MEFLRNIRIGNLAKIFICLMLVSIILAILKLIGVVGWSWEMVIFPWSIGCMMVECDIFTDMLKKWILDVSEQIDNRSENQKEYK